MVVRLFEELNLFFRDGFTIGVQLRGLLLSFRFTLCFSLALTFSFFCSFLLKFLRSVDPSHNARE
jgi:hypothetical protein